MKTAFIIALMLFLPIWSAYFIVIYLLPPAPPPPEEEWFFRYCLDYYNSDPDITVEDDCNV